MKDHEAGIDTEIENDDPEDGDIVGIVILGGIALTTIILIVASVIMWVVAG